jgi:hypothetical protein
MGKIADWFPPLTGILFIIALFVGFSVGGEAPAMSEPQKLLDHFDDNDSVLIGAFFEGLAAILFVYFGGYVRKALRVAEGETGFLSAVAFGGTLVFAVAIAIDSTLVVALHDNARKIGTSGTLVLSALYKTDFIPIAVGTLTFLSATGISIVRNGLVPKWIGWVAIVAAILGLTPLFFVPLIVTAILVIYLSIVFISRAGRGAPATAPASAA